MVAISKSNNNTLQAFWVGLGSLSSFLLGIISAAILSRYLDKGEYGTYRQIIFVYNTLLVIFSAGLPKIFAYYLPRHPLAQGKFIVWKITKLLFIFGLLFSTFLFLFSDWISEILNNPALSLGLKYFSIIPVLLLPTLGIEGIFSTYKKTKYIAVYNSISRLLMLLLIVLPVILFDGSYLSAIIGWIIASILSIVLAFYIKSIPFKNVISEETTLSLKEIFTFSAPIVMASLAGTAIRSADQFFISRYFGKEELAVFANGFIELPFVTMITSSASIVLMPVFSKFFNENENIDRLIDTWRSALSKSAIIIYPLVVYFLVFASEIMIFLYSEKYTESAKYFQIKLLVNFFNIILFTPLFISSGRTKLYFQLHLLFASLIWVVDYLIVLYFTKPIFIGFSSVFFQILKVMFFMFIASKIVKVNFLKFFPILLLSKLLLHSLICILCVEVVHFYLLKDFTLILQLIMSFLLYCIILLSTSRIFNIDYFKIIKPILSKLKLKYHDFTG